MTTSLKGFRFLVAEDDRCLLLVLKAALTKRGALVQTACNGEEAWRLFQSEEFDMVISDVQMPIMSGKELLEKIRIKDKVKPVFFMVTGQSQLTEKDALQLGASGLAHKPFKLGFLIETLESLLSKTSAA